MADVVTILVTFHVNPGHKAEFTERLRELCETMAQEKTFINSFVTEDLDDPNTLYNYETWAESRESFMETHFTKTYRKPYEDELPRLLRNRTITWLSAPIIRLEAGEKVPW